MAKIDTDTFKWSPGDILEARTSGKHYEVLNRYSEYQPHRLGEGVVGYSVVGYSVVGRRNGKRFGPARPMAETSFNTFRIVEPA